MSTYIISFSSGYRINVAHKPDPSTAPMRLPAFLSPSSLLLAGILSGDQRGCTKGILAVKRNVKEKVQFISSTATFSIALPYKSFIK